MAGPKTKPEAKATEEVTVTPLFALHKIVYGKQRTAEPNSIFLPVSENERDELLAMEAARELTDDEKVLAAELDLGAPDAPTNDAPASGEASKTGDEIE